MLDFSATLAIGGISRSMASIESIELLTDSLVSELKLITTIKRI